LRFEGRCGMNIRPAW